jgi:hypothetical protein
VELRFYRGAVFAPPTQPVPVGAVRVESDGDGAATV